MINLVVHASSNTFLDAWPPNCIFGLDPSLHFNGKEGKRACARIANYEVRRELSPFPRSLRNVVTIVLLLPFICRTGKFPENSLLSTQSS